MIVVMDGGYLSESSTSLYLRGKSRQSGVRSSIRKGWYLRDIGDPSKDQLLEISLNDHVLDRSHGNFQEIGICSVGEMRIDFSARTSIQSHELVHEVFACLFSTTGIALEIGEAKFRNRTVLDLGLEYIHLVQEKDQCRVLEPMRIGNRLPQHQCFLHLILPKSAFIDRCQLLYSRHLYPLPDIDHIR